MSPEIPPLVVYRFGVYALWFRWLVVLSGIPALLLLPQALFPYSRLPLLLLLGVLAGLNGFLHYFLFRKASPSPEAPGKIVRYKPLVDLLDGLLLGAALLYTGGTKSPLFTLLPVFLLVSNLVYPLGKRILFTLYLAGLLYGIFLLEPKGAPLFQKGPWQRDPALFLLEEGYLLLAFLVSSLFHRGIARFLEEMETRRRQILGLEAFMNRLLDLLPFGIVVTSAGGEIQRWNRFAEELLEIGKDFIQNILRLKRVEFSGLSGYLEQLFLGTPLNLHDFPYIHPSRGKIWLKIAGIPPSPSQPQAIILFLDVSEEVQRREQERAIQQRVMEADKYTTLGQLALGIAHELNNPLTTVAGILQYLEYLNQRGELNPSLLEERFAEMNLQLKRIAELLKNLLQYGKPHEGAPRLQEIPLVIQEVQLLTNYAFQKAGIPLRVEMSGEIPPLLGYRSELEQLLVNLLINALDATREAKRNDPVFLRVFTRTTENGERELVFSIADRGTGIPPHLRPRLFEPFFTTKGEHGTGLGLSIAQRIVERYRGRIAIQDRPEGPGTIFEISLPYLKEFPEFSPVILPAGK